MRKRQRWIAWVAMASCGLILGFAMLTDWVSYRDYAPFVVPAVARYLAAGAASFMIPHLTTDAHQYVPVLIVLVATSLCVPICATLCTIWLLGMTGVADLVLYSALRAVAVHSVALSVSAVVGVGLGILSRGRGE